MIIISAIVCILFTSVFVSICSLPTIIFSYFPTKDFDYNLSTHPNKTHTALITCTNKV